MKRTNKVLSSTSRRNFVKSASLALGNIVVFNSSNTLREKYPVVTKGLLTIIGNPATGFSKPLDIITVQSEYEGRIEVFDGTGNSYLNQKITGNISFRVAGAIGTHFIILKNEKNELLDTASFNVNCKTEINDTHGKYRDLLNTLYNTMLGEYKREAQPFHLNGKTYFVFVSWLRDHVHTLKGMKYFYHELKSGIDLFGDFQRADGMVWDNIYTRDKEKNWWDKRFSYANFILPVENETYEFHRIPVEADVEYLFIEGIYYTWKATGDTQWMKLKVDNALKAVKYATNDAYRWSEKYQLIKRGFTIDTWDFQANEDALISGGDIMVIDKDRTRFGVMFGDNTGMSASCKYLAEMLKAAGRNQESAEILKLGEDILKRVNSLAWNGHHYTHHVPEDIKVNRDFGVDQSTQVSLSNAYSVNRGIEHEQIVAILKTYQKIRQTMPQGSPGEWYSIFPPFPRGFGIKDASKLWEYMNGGVTPIVAGELAHGAFEHGFEEYGVDILDRIMSLANTTDNYLHCTYRGAIAEEPQRQFTSLTLKDAANVKYPGKGATYKGSWIGQTKNNDPVTHKMFYNIPFEILNPDFYEKTCIEVNDTEGNQKNIQLPVNRKAASIYLLHTMTPGKFAGTLNLYYTDGTLITDYITDDKISHWWRNTNEDPPPLVSTCKKAWRSDNDEYVAFYIYGINNPQPEKYLEKIEFLGARQTQKWQILAVTMCDHEVYFTPSKISYGIPDNWGSAAVVYALLEGLAGVKDSGVAFNKVLLSPRWAMANIENVSTTVKYEASGGYVSYQYELSDSKKTLKLFFTGNAKETKVQLLLPKNKNVKKALLNDQPVNYELRTVEQSSYIVVTAKGITAHVLTLFFT